MRIYKGNPPASGGLLNLLTGLDRTKPLSQNIT